MDAVFPDTAPPTDASLNPDLPLEAWAAALDVPWSDGGTRQLTPIEIPPAAQAHDCGPSCKQVTFLPGFRSCTSFGDPFAVDGDYLTTPMGFTRGNGTQLCMQAYVDLRTLKAYAFGAILAGTSSTACGSAALSAARVGYACGGERSASDGAAELRVFDIASRTERLLWRAASYAELDQPMSIAFVGDNLAEIMRPGCPACDTVLLSPLAGGSRQQLYPISGAPGSVSTVGGAYPYVVFFDFDRFYAAGLGVEVVAVDVRTPEQVIKVSNQANDQFDPRISGTKVVWVDTRNDPQSSWAEQGNTDIYAKDIVTAEEWAVCTDMARQDSPDIEGDAVVWMDDRNAPPNVRNASDPYFRTLPGGTEQRLAIASDGSRGYLRINGGRAFFVWAREGEVYDQVYMIDLRELGLVP
jgi:beta propeller repeat protein